MITNEERALAWRSALHRDRFEPTDEGSAQRSWRGTLPSLFSSALSNRFRRSRISPRRPSGIRWQANWLPTPPTKNPQGRAVWHRRAILRPAQKTDGGPFDEVFRHTPANRCRIRKAASMTSDQGTAGSGSRSKYIRSGRSGWSMRAPHGWISRTPI